MPLPKALLNRRYTDSSLVFKDQKFNGAVFMLKFLNHLQQRSDHLSRVMALPPYDWPESLQRSSEHNAVILNTIQHTMRDMGMDQSAEEKAFLKLK